MIDKSELKTGFWLGIGLLAALFIWGILAMFFGKVVRR